MAEMSLTDYVEESSNVWLSINPLEYEAAIPFYIFLIVGFIVDYINLRSKDGTNSCKLGLNQRSYKITQGLFFFCSIIYVVYIYIAIFLTHNTEAFNTLNVIAEPDHIGIIDQILKEGKKNHYTIPSSTFYQALFFLFGIFFYWSWKLLFIQITERKRMSLSIIFFIEYVFFSFAIILTGTYFLDIPFKLLINTDIPFFIEVILDVLMVYTIMSIVFLFCSAKYIIQSYKEHFVSNSR